VSAKVTLPRFDLEAHRGGRDLWPENTLDSFRHAVALGASTLEMDVQITKDGIPVLSHSYQLEAYLAKDAQGRWVRKGHEPAFHNLTLAQVKRYDVGSINPAADPDYWHDHGRLQEPSPGERVPTLDEMFTMVEGTGNQTVRFDIETKSYAHLPDNTVNPDPQKFVKLIMDVVHQHHMENRVILESFDWRTLLEARRQDKNTTTSALTCEVPEWGSEGLYRYEKSPGCSPYMAGLDIKDFGMDWVKASHAVYADIVSPYYKELTPQYVLECHQLGMKMVPWTVDTRAEMIQIMDMGVDGIITDRPDLLRDLLNERHIPY
jgi:glycerophosphoryl diester phosphodiesterase